MNWTEKEDILITVIVPVYNSEKYLRICLESIVNQTYRNLDIILVDDGSWDSSGEICDEFAERDVRIRVIHKDNEGLVAARKTGIKHARGKYITFVDSDDYIDITAYDEIMREMDDSFPDLVAYGLMEEYSDHTFRQENHFYPGLYDRKDIEKEIFPQMLSYGNFFDFGILPNLVCKFIRHEFLHTIDLEISNNVSVGEDADMTFQMMICVETLQLIDKYPYHYCKHEGSMMWKALSYDSIRSLENDLRQAFIKTEFYESFRGQLERYITFVSLLKNPRYIMGEKFLPGFDKVALYGAGGFGQALYNEYSDKIRLWVDKNYLKYVNNKFSVTEIESLYENKMEFDCIYIAILNTELCEKIKTVLIDSGMHKPIYYFEM